MIQVKPVGNRILVKVNQSNSEKVVDGIVIPAFANKEIPQNGTIIAVGDKVDGNLFKTGATVIYGKYSLTEISVNGVKLHFVDKDEVLGILE